MDVIEKNLREGLNARKLGTAAARQQAEAMFPPEVLRRREDNASGERRARAVPGQPRPLRLG